MGRHQPNPRKGSWTESKTPTIATDATGIVRAVEIKYSPSWKGYQLSFTVRPKQVEDRVWDNGKGEYVQGMVTQPHSFRQESDDFGSALSASGARKISESVGMDIKRDTHGRDIDNEPVQIMTYITPDPLAVVNVLLEKGFIAKTSQEKVVGEVSRIVQQQHQASAGGGIA